MIPTADWYRRVRRERLLGVSRADRTLAGLAGFPTPFTVHPHPPSIAGSVGGIGTVQGSADEGPQHMSDKSPRQSMTKKSGKSLKEKRADKHAKAAAKASSADAVHDLKR